MNLQEFAALKVGDEIENPMTHSHGVVSHLTNNGVRVRWGEGDTFFFYPVNSTAWMHWSKTDDGQGDTAASGDAPTT